MKVRDEVRRMGGAALVAELRERGHSLHAIRMAAEREQLIRPRRGWVADHLLDSELLFAVKHGVLLSCVTLARRAGLWVPEAPIRPHVAARSPSAHVSVGARVHWSIPIVPRPPGALLDPLPNMLHHVARCLPREESLTIWESALNKGLTTIEHLSQFPFPTSTRHLLADCTPFADSGLETLFRTRLRWLRVPIKAQSWVHGHRVDLLIGDGLIVQIDGRQHAGAQKVSDHRHDIAVQAAGYHTIRVGYAQVVHDWPSVQEAIQNAVANGLHRRRRR